MNCEEIREKMPDVAAGMTEFSGEENQHLAGCGGCTQKLKEMRATMTLLEEWQVPEPSPYFDVRLQARLREEMAKPQPWGWLQWFRRPVLAAALTVAMGVGVGLFFAHNRGIYNRPDEPIASVEPVEPGSAVGDLQALDKNHELYSDFDLLDDLDVQKDVAANP